MKPPKIPNVSAEFNIFLAVLAGLMLGSAIWNQETGIGRGALVIAAVAMIVGACNGVRNDRERL